VRYIRPKADDSNRTAAEAMAQRLARRPGNVRAILPLGRPKASLQPYQAFPRRFLPTHGVPKDNCATGYPIRAPEGLRSGGLARNCVFPCMVRRPCPEGTRPCRFVLASPEGLAVASRRELVSCPPGRGREGFSPSEDEKIPDPIRDPRPRRNGSMPYEACASCCPRRCRRERWPEGLRMGPE
jgi:hypothetical protein